MRTEGKLLLDEMLESDGWLFALGLLSRKLSNERTAVQTNLRRTIGVDLALATASASQARVDALVSFVFDLYAEAGAEMPPSVEVLLCSPAKLR